ncbi:MAG: DUF3135 domain-containing protein [Deltaproteobacteria bacterium]|nr:DUF3135 domain-containing protein [Deltaproteobacteria bacterium]
MEEKETRRQKALEEHDRLHQLFVKDRLSFERERKRMIEDVIKSAISKEEKDRLRAIQAKWDKRMKGAGSQDNRFVLAQTFFWEHFQEKFNPTLQNLNAVLNGEPDRDG